MGNYIIKDGIDNMNFDRITEMLSKSYWCTGIKIDEVKKGAENSALNTGAFTEDDFQIGYARVISDKTRFAYILDVYVDENFRKKGIGQSMVKHMLNHEELKDVYQWFLMTSDAHGVYSKLGFKPLTNVDKWMEKRAKRPVR